MRPLGSFAGLKGVSRCLMILATGFDKLTFFKVTIYWKE
jgi:hypothetical protein